MEYGADAPSLRKLVLASKGILAWLWRLFPNHPDLFPALFSDEPATPTDNCVIKPLFSIKGYNVTLRDPSPPGGGLYSRFVSHAVAT